MFISFQDDPNLILLGSNVVNLRYNLGSGWGRKQVTQMVRSYVLTKNAKLNSYITYMQKNSIYKENNLF